MNIVSVRLIGSGASIAYTAAGAICSLRSDEPPRPELAAALSAFADPIAGRLHANPDHLKIRAVVQTPPATRPTPTDHGALRILAQLVTPDSGSGASLVVRLDEITVELRRLINNLTDEARLYLRGSRAQGLLDLRDDTTGSTSFPAGSPRRSPFGEGGPDEGEPSDPHDGLYPNPPRKRRIE